MQDRKLRVGLSKWRVLPTAVAAAWVLTACHGKVRRFPDDLNQIETSNQADPGGGAPTNASDLISPSSSEGSKEGSPAPRGFDNSQLQAGPREEDVCSGDGDAGSCPPRSLCGPDAGDVCEATCPGCLIEGECIATGELDPATTCRICDPARFPGGWSPNDGATCDDQLFCTVDDVCSAGTCNGSPRDCEDDVACNGVSTCSEATRTCSPDVNRCGNNALCNVQTDSCVSTCAGCIIDGVCLPVGTETSGNPCLVCDPTRSTTAYTAAPGKPCGAGPTRCSQQDTCDGQGQCQPNHLAANTPCGNTASGPCDQPDSCDGNGDCQQRFPANGAACDDGAFCTVGDQCQGGQCVPTANQNCGTSRVCNETANQCQCQGCQVNNTCVATGSLNPSNPCQVCDPSRSTAAFSANEGAVCGSPATECSGRDTCNTEGQCVPNDRTGSCSSVQGGTCQSGRCVATTLPPGSPCSVGADCSGGLRTSWFLDNDGDGFGAGIPVRTCGTAPPAPPLMFTVYRTQAGDCCDTGQAADLVNPSQTVSSASPSPCGGYDRNCNGFEEPMGLFVTCAGPATVPCVARAGLVGQGPGALACGGGILTVRECRLANDGSCVDSGTLVGTGLACR